jgi:L-cystine uptake protein TcyP (sodium:dicarboxylate symporter family)
LGLVSPIIVKAYIAIFLCFVTRALLLSVLVVTPLQ